MCRASGSGSGTKESKQEGQRMTALHGGFLADSKERQKGASERRSDSFLCSKVMSRQALPEPVLRRLRSVTPPNASLRRRNHENLERAAS